MPLQLIGDEIHFEGAIAALVATTLPATVLERFYEQLNATPSGDYDLALDNLEAAAKEITRGGLLRVADLATIIARLKKDKE